MTKKELVELLNANFADGDEVFVRYEDDHDECVGSIDCIKDITQNFVETHCEVLKDGTWTRWENKYAHPTYLGFREGEWRRVFDREWSETKRCICVK